MAWQGRSLGKKSTPRSRCRSDQQGKPMPTIDMQPAQTIERWDTQKLVALSYVWGFLLVIVVLIVLMLFKVDPPIALLSVLTTLAGGLMTQSNNVAQYFFGTNKQSQTKDSTILAQALGATGAGNGGGSPLTATVTAPTATSPGSATVTSTDPAIPAKAA